MTPRTHNRIVEIVGGLLIAWTAVSAVVGLIGAVR